MLVKIYDVYVNYIFLKRVHYFGYAQQLLNDHKGVENTYIETIYRRI